MNLREDKGWAYGAGASIRYWPATGSFRANSAVRADATKDAVRELGKEIRGMAEGGIKPDELQREKNGAILSLPGLFATGADTLGTIQGLVYYGLPLDEYARFVPAIEAVTQASASTAAKSHLKPAELKVLVVGDAATQLAGLKELLAICELGPGELVMLDGDGKVIAAPAGK
jgi:zinc protease